MANIFEAGRNVKEKIKQDFRRSHVRPLVEKVSGELIEAKRRVIDCDHTPMRAVHEEHDQTYSPYNRFQ